MSNPNDYDLKLQELKEAATDKWLMQNLLDLNAFNDLLAYLQKKI